MARNRDAGLSIRNSPIFSENEPDIGDTEMYRGSWIRLHLLQSENSAGIYVLIMSIFAYFCVYALRIPLFVSSYEGETLGQMPLKDALALAQTVGLVVGKIFSLKYSPVLKRHQWRPALNLIILGSTVSTVGLAVPNNTIRVLSIFISSVWVSPTWGIFLRYTEGRQMSDAMLASFNFSFIAASGIWRSIGSALLNYGISQWWMPLIASSVSFCGFYICLSFLDLAPDPTVAEQAKRSKRKPASTKDQLAFCSHWWLGLLGLILMYSLFSTLRVFRDFFNPEIWQSFTKGDVPSSVYTITEIPVGLSIPLSLIFLYKVEDNTVALFGIFGYIICGCVILGVGTLLFTFEVVSGFFWMILLGFGVFMVYVPLGSIIYERLMAVSSESITMSFLSYISDLCGSSATSVLLIYRSFAPKAEDDFYRSFFEAFAYIAAISGICIMALTALYFFFRIRKLDFEPPYTKDLESEPQSPISESLSPTEDL
eukprot:62610_1